jgi:hypothetical protein
LCSDRAPSRTSQPLRLRSPGAQTAEPQPHAARSVLAGNDRDAGAWGTSRVARNPLRMPTAEPVARSAALEALPAVILSLAVFGAATRAIIHAQRLSVIALPSFATLEIVRDAVGSPTAWIAGGTCVLGIALGVSRRSHTPPAVALLLGTVLVYFHTMAVLLEPVTGIVDLRSLVMVSWLYMPQSLALSCLTAHFAVALRQRSASRAFEAGKGSAKGAP